MGFLLLIFGLCLIVPLSGALKGNARLTAMLWFAIGFAIFFYPTVPQFGIMISGINQWPGHTKGFEVTIVDLAVVAYLLSQRGQKPAQKDGPKLPFRLGMISYFAVVFVSVFLSGINVIGLYYVFQLLRVYVIYKAVARAAQNPLNLERLLDGLCAGLVMELGFVLVQKFAFHVAQPTGTFYHQNILGVTNNMLLVVLATPLLAQKGKLLRVAAVGAAVLIPALIASRGTAMLALAALATTYCFSIYRSSSSRKTAVGMAGVVIAAALVPLAFSSFGDRFKGGEWEAFQDKGYDERAAYKAAAWDMLGDHPLGVGPNNFVVTANVQGYYQRNGVDPNFASLSGSVHNIYLLTACENGWLGLAALLVLLLTPVVRGFNAVRKQVTGFDGETIAGITVALTFCYIHSFYEWMLVLADPQYTLAIVMGILAALLMKHEKPLLAGRTIERGTDVSFYHGTQPPLPARKLIKY